MRLDGRCRWWARVPVVAVLIGASAAFAAGAFAQQTPAGLAFGPYLTLGRPFNLQGTSASAAMAADGESLLVWNAFRGGRSRVVGARIAPDAARAGGVLALSGGRRSASDAAVSLAPAGTAAVAWFTQRWLGGESEVDEADALQLRLRRAGGRFGRVRTVWRPAPHSGFQAGSLAVAVDANGDVALAWILLKGDRRLLMLASSRAGGRFTGPVSLGTAGARADVALAVDPAGEASVIWAGPRDRRVLACSWPVGGGPGAVTVLDRSGLPQSAGEALRDLRIQSNGAGDELASWLEGATYPSGRPHLAALRAAWRLPGGSFGPAETVSPPGVEVQSANVSIAGDGRALASFTEIDDLGEGPYSNYATAPPGGAFTLAGASLPGALQQARDLKMSWLSDEGALAVWLAGGSLLAARVVPGGAISNPTVLATAAQHPQDAVIASGGEGTPVIAWAGSAGWDQPPRELQYAAALAPPEIAPSIALAGTRDLAGERGVRVAVRCLRECEISAQAHLYTAAETELFIEGYRPIASLLPMDSRRIPAARNAIVRIGVTRRALRAYCHSVHDHHRIYAEVQVRVRAAHGDASRSVALGGTVFTNGRRCHV